MKCNIDGQQECESGCRLQHCKDEYSFGDACFNGDWM